MCQSGDDSSLNLALLDVSNRAILFTDRAILNRQQIESRDLKPILKAKNSKALTAIRTVFAFAIRIVRFEISLQTGVMAANWQRGFEVKNVYYENGIVYFWVPP